METLTPAQQELFDWLIEYIRTTQHAPSIRQMMKAMNLKSPAPVQSRLERLRNKGYIDWIDGKARTLRILHQPEKGLEILGSIAAGGLVEPFTEDKIRLDLSEVFAQSDHYVLRVTGDSMIEDSIIEGDLVIMRSVESPDEAKSEKRFEGYTVRPLGEYTHVLLGSAYHGLYRYGAALGHSRIQKRSL